MRKVGTSVRRRRRLYGLYEGGVPKTWTPKVPRKKGNSNIPNEGEERV